MLPVVTPEEMAAIDADASEPVEVLIGRAGRALARHALDLLGGSYGRRVAVLVGTGNNGADGRVAAHVLSRRGVRVEVVEVGAGRVPDSVDLVVDAAFGTGLSRPWEPPAVSAPVLACDIPSGLDGLTGERVGSPWSAAATCTFAALKPGLLLGEGPALSGTVRLVDVGLDVGRASTWLATDDDVRAALPVRSPQAHKWRSAVRLIAGSPGMTGAAVLSAEAASRAGSGMIVVSAPGGGPPGGLPVQCVARRLPAQRWVDEVLDDLDRFGSLVVGPGLGRDDATLDEAAELVARAPVPVVVDADAIAAVARRSDVLAGRAASTILTPHDGEFETLTGSRPGPDRIDAVRRAAAERDVVILLKGSPTLVARSDGRVVVVAEGDERLATAGTGDVLSGVIGALLASGLDAPEAGWAGAFVHGRAGRRCPLDGTVAPDVAAEVGPAVTELRGG